jgi:hypothetical protein
MCRCFLRSALWIIANGGHMLVFGSKVPDLSIARRSVERRARSLAISLASATAAA